MKTSRDKTLKDKTLNKIRFLEDQLVSLDHYLPETYEYLMEELDLQKRNLAKIEIEEHYPLKISQWVVFFRGLNGKNDEFRTLTQS